MNADPGSTSPLTGQIILIIILTLINALFAAAEMAFVALNQRKVEQMATEGNKKARRVMHLLDEADDFLSTIQVAITLAGFLNSAAAATSVASRIEPLFGGITGAYTLSVVSITIIISYVTLVFGELFPKAIALQMPEKVALATGGMILFVQRIAKPFIWLLSGSVDILKKITPIDFEAKEETMTRDEFRAYIEQSRQHEVIDIEEFSMLKGVLSLDNKIAREVMVPRTDTYMLDYDDGNEENIDKLLDIQYSRVPVYFEDKDNILGIVHVKNLLKASKEKFLHDIDLKDVMNEALFVPETIYIDDLLYELKRTRNQMAILNDEYGGVVGIVTLEDLLEEIVGEIDDEYDETSNLIEQLEENRYLVEGSTPIDKFNDFFGTKIYSEDVDTIAGFFITEYGNIPQENEDVFIKIDNYLLQVNAIEGTRILNIFVEKSDEENQTEQESANGEEKKKS
ncbi:hemolysin family protein [Lacticigenium naphthae]|uniref:hemolysin family protein n=1 Tax=Lacticigenium naphthae TaxID=515351 RepID=UPI000410A660|nr:hemolysin family protein [Lacticigenium naphthae]